LTGKSVHWSPALVGRATLKTLPTQTSGQFTPSSNLSPGRKVRFQLPKSILTLLFTAPPLRSMRDEIEPVRKVTRRSMSIPATTDTSFSSAAALRSPPEQPQSSADTWVTVYGFPPEQAANVLKHFSRHGEIVSHQVPSRGNWMHIRYSCPVHARQALSRNASLIDASLRVGVVPCTEKVVQTLKNILTFVRLMLASAVLRTIDARRFSRSRLSMASRAGMRSLTVSYDSRQEPKVRCYVFVSIYFDPLLRSY
uniref:Nucleoporin NUP35 n=1 Tax=Heligmosomoides polygyrus TaxID=6339 RepID=A0A183FZY0_HELPZ